MERNFTMRKLFVSSAIVLFVTVISLPILFGQTRQRPNTEKATTNDFKVKYRVTTGAAGVPGQSSESITMIKGARERSESHSGYGDTINILQCDLKRTIQISEASKKYVITPIETGERSPSATTPAPGNSEPVRRGGILSYTTSVIDTGERREMFGFTARHVKSSTVIESSPDACNAVNQRIEIDGWYVDLTVGLDCQTGRPPVMPSRAPRSGCQDQTRFKHEGNGKLGYPLIESMSMYGEGGRVMFTTSKEVVELSRQPLDIALFDIPSGYTEAASTQELYVTPGMAEGTGRTQTGGETPNVTRPPGTTPEIKKASGLLVGVVQINNKAGRPVSQDALRDRLVAQLSQSGVTAIPLNAISQMEAESEAKVKQCDFILYTDVTALKGSKLGGMFGRVTGVQGAGTTEAKIEFKLFAVGESVPRLQSSTTAKEEGDEASAGTAIDAEARLVSGEVRKRGRG